MTWPWTGDRLVVCELDRPGGKATRHLTEPMPYDQALAEYDRLRKTTTKPLGVAWTHFDERVRK